MRSVVGKKGWKLFSTFGQVVGFDVHLENEKWWGRGKSGNEVAADCHDESGVAA